MIPLKYMLRSLSVRWVTTLLTCLAIGIVVFASVLTFGMVEGIEHALASSGDATDLIIMRKGSNNELSSTIAPTAARELMNLEGIAKDAGGQPLASREFITVLIRPRRDARGTANVMVRGLDQVGRQLRPKFTITEGRDLEPGVNELVASKRISARFENFGLDESIEINNVKFKVVGLFEAGGSAAESEVWADLRDLTSAQRYNGAISVVNMRVPEESDRQAIIERVRDNDQFKLSAVTETDYFENQQSASLAIKVIAYIIAAFLTVGAMFAAANTMYAAVSSRSREIGTLRALGFPRFTVLISFMLESLVICLIGGVLGCLATLPLNGWSGGTQNMSTFSEITFSFRFGPKVLLLGMGLALAMGLIGGFFPAIRAIRMQITNALRQA
jgi:putative ABC transport system permease protein